MPGPSWLYEADINPGAYPGYGYSTHLSTSPRFLVTVLALTLSSSNELRRPLGGEWPACVDSCLYGQLCGLLQMIGLSRVSDSQWIAIELGLLGPFSETSFGVNSVMNSNNPETPGRGKVTSCLVRPRLLSLGGPHCEWEWFGFLCLLRLWSLTPPI